MPDRYREFGNENEGENTSKTDRGENRNSAQRRSRGSSGRSTQNKKNSVLDNVKNAISSTFSGNKNNKTNDRRRSRQRPDNVSKNDNNSSYRNGGNSSSSRERSNGNYKSYKKSSRFDNVISLLKELWFYRKKEILLTVACVATLIVFVNAIQFFVGNNAYEVNINDKPIGILKNTSDAIEDYEKTIITLTENKLINSAGANVQILDKITLTHVRSSSKDMSSEESILSTLAQSLNYKVSAVQIVVDGVVKTTVDSMAMADDITNKMIAEYIPIDAVVVDTGFAEDVVKEVVYVYPSDINTYEKAVDILSDTHLVDGTYRIVSGDSAWSIANRNGITKEALYQMNEGMDDDTKLIVGQDINLHAEQPLLSVKVVQEITYTQTIKKTSQTIENSDQKSSYSRVVQQGKDGEELVTAHQTRINGYVVGIDEVVSTQTIVEPVPEIIEKGIS